MKGRKKGGGEKGSRKGKKEGKNKWRELFSLTLSRVTWNISHRLVSEELSWEWAWGMEAMAASEQHHYHHKAYAFWGERWQQHFDFKGRAVSCSCARTHVKDTCQAFTESEEGAFPTRFPPIHRDHKTKMLSKMLVIGCQRWLLHPQHLVTSWVPEALHHKGCI